MTKRHTNEYDFIITHHQEILQCPLTYGLFATLDEYHRPLSSTIKVMLLFFEIKISYIEIV